ncbi:NUDIX domain-containing protein [Candidatus Falkowbacteria bacterium]|nr:NUDIX domain-containing protein [Candidatus Falkowbacteria bacterium]
MAEMITTYELRDKRIPLPMDRAEFYDEQIKTFQASGQPTRACEVVSLLLFTVDGEMVLQKRAHHKNHNPGLIDKAIGGHVQYGDSPFYTLMVETVQELRVPSIVLHTPEEFRKTYKLLEGYLGQIAIVKFLDEAFLELPKIFKEGGDTITIANKVQLFIGVYGGSTKPVDKEASGVLYYDLKTLRAEIEASPAAFTADLKLLLTTYDREIQDFLTEIKG